MARAKRRERPEDEDPSVSDWGYDADMQYTGMVPAEMVNTLIDRGFWVDATQPVAGRDDSLDLHLVYDVDDQGRPQLFSLKISVYAGGEGISAAHLRGVRLGEIHAQVRAILQRGEPDEMFDGGPENNPPMPPDDWATEFRQTPRPGRRGRDDKWYAELARAYVSSPSQTPIKELAEEHHLSRSQIGNLLQEAKKRGILSAGTPGKAGGRLTEYGKELLNGAH